MFRYTIITYKSSFYCVGESFFSKILSLCIRCCYEECLFLANDSQSDAKCFGCFFGEGDGDVVVLDGVADGAACGEVNDA